MRESPRNHAARLIGPRLTLVAGVLAALLGGAAPILAAYQPAAAPTPYDLLVDLASTPEQRLEAATQILQDTQDTETLTQALALLTTDPTGGDAARTVLLATSRLSQAPSGFYPPLLSLAKDEASPLRVDAVRALGACRTREAAAALVEFTTDTIPPSVRDAAFASLSQLSGRDDLGPSAEAWRAWLARCLGLSERQWEQELLLAQARRAQRLEANLADAERRLVDAWRQIHLLTPVESRSGVLVRLLTQDAPVLRNLGFELVNREISENRVLQPAVSQAAIDLLRNSDPLVRAQAALILNRLVPPEAQEAVVTALGAETDPRAADALLQAASRWPSASSIQPALRWLGASPSLRVRAAGLAWALYRAGHLTSEQDRATVLQAVRSLETASLTGPACRLLATFGDESDLARLQDLLRSSEPAVRATAADALGLRADQMSVLLAAAATDPSIFEATAKAALTHLHDAQGYSAVAGLPAPSPQVRTRVLAEYAGALSTGELVRLARQTSDASEALPLLKPLISPERLSTTDELAHLAEGLLLLARANVEVGNPGDALNALSLIPEAQTPAGPQDLIDLRVMLLLWLNRIDQAEEFDGSPAAWLEALEHALGEPHAALIAARMEDRFGPSLSPELRERLQRLRQKVADADSVTTGGDG